MAETAAQCGGLFPLKTTSSASSGVFVVKSNRKRRELGSWARGPQQGCSLVNGVETMRPLASHHSNCPPSLVLRRA